MFILEDEQNKPFKIKGIAMIKNSISKNGRHYSGKLVESTVDKIKSVIESKGSYPITMQADHPTGITNQTLSTVGKISAIYLEGDNAIIEAEIANTTLGKDVQELVRGGFVEGLSIRASKAKSVRKNISGQMVNDITEMELKGVDLVTNPGVDGARVIDILESSDSSTFISIIEEETFEKEEDNEVKLIEASLEDFKSKRPDLYESIKKELESSIKESFKVDELTESVNTLNSDKLALETTIKESEETINNLKESVNDLTTKLEESTNKLNEIKESEEKAKRDSHIASKISELKYADSVKSKIKEKLDVLESTEEIDKVLEQEVEYLNMIIKESTGVNVNHKGKTGENGSNSSEVQESEFIKLVMES